MILAAQAADFSCAACISPASPPHSRASCRASSDGRTDSSSATKLSQRFPFVQRYVIGLVALDLVLRVILARMMDVTLVVQVFGVHSYDATADPAGFGIPTHVIADFEYLSHNEPLGRVHFNHSTAEDASPTSLNSAHPCTWAGVWSERVHLDGNGNWIARRECFLKCFIEERIQMRHRGSIGLVEQFCSKHDWDSPFVFFLRKH